MPALDILEICMRHRTGSVQDFGDALKAGAPFAELVCKAFSCEPSELASAVRQLAARYGLAF